MIDHLHVLAEQERHRSLRREAEARRCLKQALAAKGPRPSRYKRVARWLGGLAPHVRVGRSTEPVITMRPARQE